MLERFGPPILKDFQRGKNPQQGYIVQQHEYYKWGPLNIIVTDQEQHGEYGLWRHVSVSNPERLPTQAEMLAVRDRFFGVPATVIQIFPPREFWVNAHEFCLHLWQRLDGSFLPEGLHGTVGPLETAR